MFLLLIGSSLVGPTIGTRPSTRPPPEQSPLTTTRGRDVLSFSSVCTPSTASDRLARLPHDPSGLHYRNRRECRLLPGPSARRERRTSIACRRPPNRPRLAPRRSSDQPAPPRTSSPRSRSPPPSP